jgi:predicted DNA binding protein
VEAVLDGLVSVAGYRRVSEGDDGTLYEVTVTGETLPSRLVRHGATPRSIDATPVETTVVVDVPPTVDVREFVEMLREAFPSVELVARRSVERTTQTRQELTASLFGALTDRQLEVLRTAYYAGFFEWPRESTGEDIAAMLDVTQPTVNRHLRVAQQRLLDQLFEETPTAAVSE